MAAGLAGDQWNEGDVSLLGGAARDAARCVLRDRRALRDVPHRARTTPAIYPAVISRELARYLPFLATTKVLMAAVRAGVGREVAHEAIKEHAVKVALAMREEGRTDNDLLDRLAADPRLQLDRQALGALLAHPIGFVGAGPAQALAFARRIETIVHKHPRAAQYAPGSIL